MIHDPLCPLESECPGRDRPHFLVESDTWCGGCQIECQCELIGKVRADERQRILPLPETDDLCPYSGLSGPECKSWLCDCFEFEEKWGVSQK